MERRLVAILAADVAAYSRLTGIDEEGTLDGLARLRSQIVDPAIARHGGRIFKTTGDGLLAAFPSVVEAVRSAAGIQRDAAATDQPLPGGVASYSGSASMSATSSCPATISSATA